MSRLIADQFIFEDEDSEECCPLCVEEFDLTDKGFRPCPCGYQICQFCYNNVKNNMNGLCPACRRPYHDEDIEYKAITPEEVAAHKSRQAQKQKKTLQALQKERQKAEADNLSRKHLAGMRVVQKNLVYVTGLSPTIQEDQLLATLRGDQYFGQYGKIIKIVVSKAKDNHHPHSVGVYVTYEQKEDAASCIAAVDGSKNGDRTLRAQFGTTKYCSSYLRGETCTNRNCMFLHEPGEANESYSRADLSALNAGGSQQSNGRPPPPQSQQPLASATQTMTRQGSGDQPPSPTPDRPALPSTASWASKPPQLGQAESRSTSVTLESPAMVNAVPVADVSETSPQSDAAQLSQPEELISEVTSRLTPLPARRPQIEPLVQFVKSIKVEDFKLLWSSASIPQAERDIIENYPPLFDLNGPIRIRLRRQREEEQRRMEQEAQAFQQPPALEQDENPEMSGSLQLGGEPEDRQPVSQVQSAIQPPGQDGALDQRFQFGGTSSPGVSDRVMTPQHQQMLLQTLKPSAQSGYGQQPPSLPSTSFQQQTNPPLGHQRNVSRYSFANDSSASAAVKPVANPKLMNQQTSMMPPTGGNHFGAQHQQPSSQFYTSNVQGPPPGLKTTGTPPVSGNLTFGQGHGFATGGMQYGTGASRNQQDQIYRDLLRGGRDGVGVIDAKRGGLADVSADPSTGHLLQARLHQGAGGLGGSAFTGPTGAADDAEFPPLAPPTRQHSITSRTSLNESRISTPPIPPGFEGQIANESRRSTPTVPPGLTKPTALPDLEGSFSRPTSRPASRASVRRTVSQILPALPLRPGTPARAGTPPRKGTRDEADIAVPVETPTRPSRATTSSDLKNAMSMQEDVVTPPRQKLDGAQTMKSSVPEPIDDFPDVKDTKIPQTEQNQASAQSFASPNVSQAVLSDQDQTKSSEAIVSSTPVSQAKAAKLDIQKRNHPGKLDIAAAVTKPLQQEDVASSNTTPVDTGTPGKPQRTSQTPAPWKAPDSPSAASPAVKTAPRTLRVVQTPTPKAETPSALHSSALPNPIVHRLPSRQPSVASINLPGTPSSEHISDNISLTSTSLSRANSPPPATSKVGSAPVRVKTKSAMKKERQERAKQLEDEKAKAEEITKPSTEEPAQEAIISRKKKTKKEKEPKAPPKAKNVAATMDSVPASSTPPSPSKPILVAEPVVKTETPAAIKKSSEPTTPVRATPPPQPATQPSSEPSPPPTPTLTAAQLIAELKASAPEIQKCIDSLFRVSNSHQFKTPSNVAHKDLLSTWKSDFNVKLTKDEIDALLTGKIPAVQRGGEDGRTFDKHTITPSGAHLRALTKELEVRFLELEKALRELPDEFKFRPAKPQNEMKLPAFDLEELKRRFENSGGRGVSVMEQMVQDGSTMKKGAFLVDEASKYINEFVMPPATPPPSAGSGASRAGHLNQGGAASHAHLHAAVHSQGGVGDPSVPSVEIAERLLNDAKRIADEKENALRKMIKKNKKLLGLG